MESHRLKAVVEDVRALKGKLEKVLSSDMRTLKTEVENAVQTINTWETKWEENLNVEEPLKVTKDFWNEYLLSKIQGAAKSFGYVAFSQTRCLHCMKKMRK